MSPIYLVIVRISDDADRKRLEYVLERFSGSGVNVERLCGGVLLVEGGASAVESFLSALFGRFGRGAVRVWGLTEPGLSLSPRRLERVFRVAEGFGDVWAVVNFVMSRFRGSLISEVGGGVSRVYRVRSRHGLVDVRFDLLGGAGGRSLRVVVEGFGPSVDRFFERLVSELSYIEGG